jgi:hypothetical protein
MAPAVAVVDLPADPADPAGPDPTTPITADLDALEDLERLDQAATPMPSSSDESAPQLTLF